MDEKPNQEPIANSADQSGCCGPGCQCGGGGVGAKGKMLICILFLVAAGIVLACSIYRKAHTRQAAQPQAFATAVPAQVSTAPIEQPKVAEANLVKAAAWGEPLKDLASLSQRASDNDAVLLYIPEKSRGADEAVKRLLEQTAVKAKAGGANTAYFALDTGSEDYSKITAQMKAPLVLALAKGGGAIPVTGELTEGKLLQAIVAASRPSGCGPGGCGPTSAGCN